MQKNVSSQKAIVYAFDSTTNLSKTGDAANLTAYVSKDFGAVTVLGDTSATEMDSTNAKGYYLFDLTQAETNADTLLFSAKSSTANIVVLGMPATVYTVPANFTKAVIDSSGLIDANAVKVGPSGSGTAQTARDVGASVLLSTGTGTGQLDFTSGVVKADATQILGTAVSTPATAGILDVNVKNMNNVAGTAITTVKAVQGLTTADTVATATNLTNAPTAGDFTATMKTSIGTAVAASAVASVTARVTANTDQLAGQTVTAAAGVTFPTSVASPTNLTAGTITTVTNLTNAPTAGDLTATMKTSVTTAATAATPIAASVSGAVGSVTGNVGGNVVGSVATLTELSTTAQTELAVVPASTATLKDMLKWLFLLSRNKLTQTATTTLVKANDGSTTVGTSTVSDDSTTATRGVWS